MRRFLVVLLITALLLLLVSCSMPFNISPTETIEVSKLGKANISIDWGGSKNGKTIIITEKIINSVCVVIDDKINDPYYLYTFKRGGWNMWALSLAEGYHKIMAIDEGESVANSSNTKNFKIASGSNIKIEIQPGGGVFIDSNL